MRQPVGGPATFDPVAEPSIFRRLWQLPGRYEDRATDRRVTFLELFFDLVFVVVISQLAHHLATHPSWSGVGWFVFLFYAVWSSWLNGTLYHDLHTTNDVSVRVFTFAQMLAVSVMAVFIGDIPGEGSTGFALAYAANTFVLVILWFRTGLHDPHHRPGSFPYSAGYLDRGPPVRGQRRVRRAACGTGCGRSHWPPRWPDGSSACIDGSRPPPRAVMRASRRPRR